MISDPSPLKRDVLSSTPPGTNHQQTQLSNINELAGDTLVFVCIFHLQQRSCSDL